MDDLGELKGRVARATRALSERDAEEQGRHAKLIALVAALEAKSLEARRDKERAEQRLSEVETENEELRRLLVGLLDAVEAGSRSRFADAIYALEARIGSLSERAGGTAVPEQEASEAETGPDHAFTAELAASCAVEEELAAQAEERRAEAAEDTVALLERIRAQLCLPDAPQSATESEGEPSTGRPQDVADAADEAPEDGDSDLDPSEWERRRAAL